VFLDHLGGQPETYTRSTNLLGRVESLEDVRHMFRGDSTSVVTEEESDS